MADNSIKDPAEDPAKNTDKKSIETINDKEKSGKDPLKELTEDLDEMFDDDLEGIFDDSLDEEVEEPVETSDEEPVEVSDEEPVEVSDEEPVEVADEEPVEASDEEPVEAAEEEPVEVADEEPVEAADEEPVEASDEEPVEASDEEPVGVADEEPVEASDEAFDEELDEAFDEELDEESGYVPDDSTESIDHLENMSDIVLHLESRWGAFQLHVITPRLPVFNPPIVIPPAPLIDAEGIEFVYTIHDYGHSMATSKAEDMVSVGMSMCKLYSTIEKMVYLLIERLKSTGISTEEEVQVAFFGFTAAQRKGFESVVNLSYNVVVTNFEPGAWGNRYLETVKRLADKGYGYPSEAPRDSFRHGVSSGGMKKP